MGTTGTVLGAALLAGAVATGVTVAIERLGGRVGGLLGTLPTTIVPAAFGFAATARSPEALRDTLFAVPVGMLVNAVFLWTWRALPSRLPGGSLALRLAAMGAASLSVWAVLAALSVALLDATRDAGVPVVLLGGGAFVVSVGIGVLACLRHVPAPRGGRRATPLALVARGALAALAIGAATALSATGDALLAGMASVFPAIFLTAMISLWWSQGEAVPAGAVGPMMLGSASVSAFALLAAVAMPELGSLPGAGLAWIGAALLVTVPATWWTGTRGPVPRGPSR